MGRVCVYTLNELYKHVIPRKVPLFRSPHCSGQITYSNTPQPHPRGIMRMKSNTQCFANKGVIRLHFTVYTIMDNGCGAPE